MAIRIGNRFRPLLIGMTLLLALLFSTGCQTSRVVGDEHWAPANSNLPKLQGVDMPAGTSGNAPMPDGWKSSKLY